MAKIRRDLAKFAELCATANWTEGRYFRKDGQRHLEELSDLLKSDEAVLLMHYPTIPSSMYNKHTSPNGYLLVTMSRVLFWAPDYGVINLPHSTITRFTATPGATGRRQSSSLFLEARGSDYTFLFNYSPGNVRERAKEFVRAITQAQVAAQ